MLRRIIKVLNIILLLTVAPYFLGQIKWLNSSKDANFWDFYGMGLTAIAAIVLLIFLIYFLFTHIWTYIGTGRWDIGNFWNPLD